MKRFLLLAAGLAALGLGAPAAFATSAGSFSAQISNAALIPTVVCAPATAGSSSCNGSNLMSTTISTPNGGSLLVTGSLETSILTDTTTKGNGGSNTASATGSVVVTLVVDGNTSNYTGCSTTTFPCPNGVAYPSAVTYDERTQTLTTTLSGCTTTSSGINCNTPESIELLLSTTSAHSFNFVVPNLKAGSHTIQMNIAVQGDDTSTSVAANANVSVGVGVGSLTVQAVKTETPVDSITLGSDNNLNWTF